MLLASDIMTTEVLSAAPHTSIDEVAKLLVDKRINGVPVVDADGNLAGVITQTDLINQARDLELPPALNILDLHLYLQIPSRMMQRIEKLLGRTVGEVMSKNPIYVAPDTPARDIAALMERKQAHTIPVVEAGKLVGVIGRVDLIRALAYKGRG
jgi:CBS domain-containing protein